MGDGIFARAGLSAAQWYDFGNRQRSHLKQLEDLPLALVLVFGSGIFTPHLAAGAGVWYAIGRYMMGLGYVSGGPEGRHPWGYLTTLALVPCLGVALYAGVTTGLKGDGIDVASFLPALPSFL